MNVHVRYEIGRNPERIAIVQKITVIVAASNGIKESLATFNTYICAEILADKLEIVPEIQGGTTIELNDVLLNVIVSKKG